jgi:hypothetical protein
MNVQYTTEGEHIIIIIKRENEIKRERLRNEILA